jgi:hypothetical protein
VGRLPVRTADEAALVVGKLIAYEQAAPSTEAVLVADSNDIFNFEEASGAVAPLLGGLKVTQVYRGGLDNEQARKLLLDALNRGPKLVNYVGHGSADAWHGGLLTTADAGLLQNRGRLSVYAMMTCLNGYYDAGGMSLGEAMLKAEAGGAVAVWASSGMSLPAEQSKINQEFYRQLLGGTSLRGSAVRLGEAAMRAKAASSNAEVRRTWVLLGDPSMRLR